MKTIQNTTTTFLKKEYQHPQIECMLIDNEISLQLQSPVIDDPDDPGSFTGYLYNTSQQPFNA